MLSDQAQRIMFQGMFAAVFLVFLVLGVIISLVE